MPTRSTQPRCNIHLPCLALMLAFCFSLPLSGCTAASLAASDRTSLRVQLKWLHQAQERMLAASLPMIHTGSGPIGWMEAHEWGHMHDTLLLENMLDHSLDLQGIYTPQFLEVIYGEQP